MVRKVYSRAAASVLMLTASAIAVMAVPQTSMAAPPPHVASWEIGGQFNPTQNPFEVWTYGYTAAADCSGPVIPLTNKMSMTLVGRPVDIWMKGTTAAANDLPQVLQSKGATLLNPLRYSPNGLSLHPGPKGECAVVRFQAPVGGRYRLMGRFWAQNITAGGTNTRTYVIVNGNVGSPLSVANVTALAAPTNNPFTSATIDLSTGGTIDFMVGANGSFIADSTGLHGYIQRDEP